MKAIVIVANQEESKKVQEILFSVGFSWGGMYGMTVKEYPTSVINVDDNGLLSYASGDFTCTGVKRVFYGNFFTVEKALQIEGAKKPAPKYEIDISAKWLLEVDACEGVFTWFVDRYGKKTVKSGELIAELNYQKLPDWASWLENKAKEAESKEKTREKKNTDEVAALLNAKKIPFFDMSLRSQETLKRNMDVVEIYHPGENEWHKTTVPASKMFNSAYRIKPSCIDKIDI